MSVETLSGDLIARARLALRQSPIYELRDIQVEQNGETIILSGVVSSFYHKQLAQEAVRSILADHQLNLVNRIEVLRYPVLDPD